MFLVSPSSFLHGQACVGRRPDTPRTADADIPEGQSAERLPYFFFPICSPSHPPLLMSLYLLYICLSWFYITMSLRRLFPTSRRQLSMPFHCAKLERPDDEGKYHRLFREKILWHPSAFLRTITKRYYTRRKAAFHHFLPKFLAPSSYLPLFFRHKKSL